MHLATQNQSGLLTLLRAEQIHSRVAKCHGFSLKVLLRVEKKGFRDYGCKTTFTLDQSIFKTEKYVILFLGAPNLFNSPNLFYCQNGHKKGFH